MPSRNSKRLVRSYEPVLIHNRTLPLPVDTPHPHEQFSLQDVNMTDGMVDVQKSYQPGTRKLVLHVNILGKCALRVFGVDKIIIKDLTKKSKKTRKK